jgi:hypothetical protein
MDRTEQIYDTLWQRLVEAYEVKKRASLSELGRFEALFDLYVEITGEDGESVYDRVLETSIARHEQSIAHDG